VTKSRKLSLGGGHDTVSDDFARRVLHVDGAVRREVFRKSVQKRHVLMGCDDRGHRQQAKDKSDSVGGGGGDHSANLLKPYENSA